MLTLATTNLFEKNLKKMLKRGKDKEKLKAVINFLMTQQPLPPKYKDHILVGNWQGFRECHIEPNWLLIYQITTEKLILTDTGTHADLF
ncbi:type II toxin-antitoxin system YafQ family toxin [Thiotrichales bacterium HSG1]|nr:type II toxin-antitoxin system YafQ family toxin [Thiotrichales bacterium HSG1]